MNHGSENSAPCSSHMWDDFEIIGWRGDYEEVFALVRGIFSDKDIQTIHVVREIDSIHPKHKKP